MVLTTSNAGRTWVEVSSPRAKVDVGSDRGSVDQIHFLNARDGFADGSSLWTTHDGGRHWHDVTRVAGVVNPVVSDVASAAGAVYALIARPGTDDEGGNSHLRLVRAESAHADFRVIETFPPNADVGMLVAADGVVYATAGPAEGTPRLVRIDGTGVTRTSLPSRLCTQVAASTPTALVVECGGGEASGGMGYRQVYGSADSGHSFHRLGDPGAGAGYDDAGLVALGTASFVLSTSGPRGASLLTTTDAGDTWRTSLSAANAYLSDLVFIDRTHGFVIAQPETIPGKRTRSGRTPPHTPSSELYRTNDGGTHWTRLAL